MTTTAMRFTLEKRPAALSKKTTGLSSKQINGNFRAMRLFYAFPHITPRRYSTTLIKSYLGNCEGFPTRLLQLLGWRMRLRRLKRCLADSDILFPRGKIRKS